MIRKIGTIVSMTLLAGVIGLMPAQAQDPKNAVELGDTEFVNGAVGTDTQGAIRTVYDGAALSLENNPLFEVDEFGVPTQFQTFLLFDGAYLDMEVVGNPHDFLTGVMMLDKYGAVHTQRYGTFELPPSSETPTESPTFSPMFAPRQLTSPDLGPETDYYESISEYNQENPSTPIFIPYFPFELEIPTASNGVARDIEVAVDWRNATNAFQGYYVLDAFGGVHYVNHAEVLGFLANNPAIRPEGDYTEGIETFNQIYGFRPQFLLDYAGVVDGEIQTRPAPYFRFTSDNGFPIARDLEVVVEFEPMGTDLIVESQQAEQLAIDSGIDTSKLFDSIAISPDRMNPASELYTEMVAVTQGYAILDGFGAVHTMLEDKAGNPIPAPWENLEDGLNENAPYFMPFDLAVDIEISPLQNAVLLLNRVGQVFVITGENTSEADVFVDPGIIDDLPIFGFDNARDLAVVSNDEGLIVGLYVLDRFGTVHRSGSVPKLPGEILYLPNGQSRQLELSPLQKPATRPQSNSEE